MGEEEEEEEENEEEEEEEEEEEKKEEVGKEGKEGEEEEEEESQRRKREKNRRNRERQKRKKQATAQPQQILEPKKSVWRRIGEGMRGLFWHQHQTRQSTPPPLTTLLRIIWISVRRDSLVHPLHLIHCFSLLVSFLLRYLLAQSFFFPCSN